MRSPFHIGGETIKAGQRCTVDLPIARLYTRTSMAMPVHVIHGKKKGPALFISAAIHGDEINGVEIIRRLLKLKLMKEIRGTLLAIPVVNVFGFINTSRYLPDRRDLNHFFPGNEKGSLASHLANIFMTEVVGQCQYGIDLHSGSNHRTNLPQIRVTLDCAETKRLAIAFGAPVIINSKLRDNSLRAAVVEKDIPMLLYEAGEALRFDESSIRLGLKGILTVMREIGMLPPGPPRKKKQEPVIVTSTTWLRAPKSGILNSVATIGTSVNKGDVVGTIVDPFGEKERVLVKASRNGVVIGNLNLPLVHKGDALLHLAIIDDNDILEDLAEILPYGYLSDD